MGLRPRTAEEEGKRLQGTQAQIHHHHPGEKEGTLQPQRGLPTGPLKTSAGSDSHCRRAVDDQAEAEGRVSQHGVTLDDNLHSHKMTSKSSSHTHTHTLQFDSYLVPICLDHQEILCQW